MRAIENELGIASDALEAPRPFHLAQALGRLGICDSDAGGAHGSDSQRGIEALVAAGERDGSARQWRLDKLHGSRRAQNPRRLGRLGRGDGRRARLDDARFFSRDLGEGVAKPRAMVEVDGRDDRHSRCHDIGRVEPAAHARFERDDLHIALLKMIERQRGCQLEESRMRLPASDDFADAREPGGNLILGNHGAIHANALAERDQMRRGEKS